MQSAIDTGVDVLEKLGISLSKTHGNITILVDNIQKTLADTNQQIEDLVNLPGCYWCLCQLQLLRIRR